MRIKQFLLSGMAIFAVIGCQSTIDGAKEDGAKLSEAASKKAAEAGDTLSKEAAKKTQEAKDAIADEAAKKVQDAGKALVSSAQEKANATYLSTRIKAAFVAHPVLNQDENELNVDATETELVLSGHVKTNKMKADAEEMAVAVLAQNKSKLKLVNKLEVR